MDHTFIGIARQRGVMMELRVRPQDMVGDKEVGVAHRFHSLDKLAYGSRVGTEFCLGKNRSDFHRVPPLTGPGVVTWPQYLCTIISSSAIIANHFPTVVETLAEVAVGREDVWMSVPG